MDFEPIQDQRLSDKIVTRFTKEMRNGSLTVGTKLPPEAQLAEQLGVSRGILREALTILEARGHLSRAPKGGTIITSVIGDDLGHTLSNQLRQATYRDLLEFREVMECRAVENIVRIATDEQLHRLEESLNDEQQNVSLIDRYFHYQLAVLSGNGLFCSFVDTYYELIREMKVQSLMAQERKTSVKQEHQAIMDALLARDAAKATQCVRQHLQAVRHSLEQEQTAQQTESFG